MTGTMSVRKRFLSQRSFAAGLRHFESECSGECPVSLCSRLIIFLLTAFIIIISPMTVSPVCADGGMMYARLDVGYSSDQRAVIIHHPSLGLETMILYTERGWADPAQKADYAWVIPVPSLMAQQDFTTFERGTELFGYLEHQSAPQALIDTGCAPYGCGGGSGSTKDYGVSEISSFEVDNYSITILSAQDSSLFHDWLQINGYQVPAGSIPVLDHYINEGWYFTAVKVIVPTDQGGDGGGTAPVRLDPLLMTFHTQSVLFPLYISSVSSRTDQLTEVLLYILAPDRMESSNYTTMEMTHISDSFDTYSDFESAYEREFDRLLTEAGGPAFILEYAGYMYMTGWDIPYVQDGDQFILTRLRTRLPIEYMTADVELVPAPTNDPFIVRTMIDTPGQRTARYATLSMMALLAFALAHRPLRRYGRIIKFTFLITLCAAMLLL